jgi:hypothetical protein
LEKENQINPKAEIQSRALRVQLGAKDLIGCKLGLPNKGGINLGAGEEL